MNNYVEVRILLNELKSSRKSKDQDLIVAKQPTSSGSTSPAAAKLPAATMKHLLLSSNDSSPGSTEADWVINKT
jgi:hypothetical protein